MTAQAKNLPIDLPEAKTATSAPKAKAKPPAIPKIQQANRVLVLLFAGVVIASLILGWFSRHDNNLSAAEGMGYALGLIGGIAMLSLLLYPLRKHWRAMNRLGAIKHWFRIHMILGVVGPVLVLFHSNFAFGSLNSNLAMICMLIVAGSGLIGRYMYIKIHHGLYGERASLQEVRHTLKISRGKLSDTLHLSGKNIERLKRVEGYALKRRNLLNGVIHMPFVTTYCFWMRYRIVGSLRADFKKQAKQRGWDKEILHDLSHNSLTMMKQYLKSLQRVAHFNFYERLFGLWHVVHLPLFIMLVISGLVHVYAVHTY